MSEKRRAVKDLSGKPIRDTPETRLVSRMKPGPGGVMISEFTEVPNEPLPVITATKPRPMEIEPEIRATPTKPGLRDHRAVDPSAWGKFAETGIPKIYGNQPRARNVPAVSGPPIATTSETISETGLLRRTLERFLGDKKR